MVGRDESFPTLTMFLAPRRIESTVDPLPHTCRRPLTCVGEIKRATGLICKRGGRNATTQGRPHAKASGARRPMQKVSKTLKRLSLHSLDM